MKNVIEQSMITIVKFLAKRFSNYQLDAGFDCPNRDGTVLMVAVPFVRYRGLGTPL